jgi:hypothetical protein
MMPVCVEADMAARRLSHEQALFAAGGFEFDWSAQWL